MIHVKLIFEYDVSQKGSSLLKVKVKMKSCPILCNPMDCSLPGSSVHGILQARVLEWVATSFSRGIFLTQGSNPGFPGSSVHGILQARVLEWESIKTLKRTFKLSTASELYLLSIKEMDGKKQMPLFLIGLGLLQSSRSQSSHHELPREPHTIERPSPH